MKAGNDVRVAAMCLMSVLCVIAFLSSCGCGRERSRAEKAELRRGIEEELGRQQASNEKREQVWQMLRKKFDANNDDHLSRAEESALQGYINKINEGKVPNPFQ